MPIFRRALALGMLFGFAGCHQAAPDGSLGPERRTSAEQEAHKIVCAIPGSDDFARQCVLDRNSTDQGTVLTVREPDGGFHRLLIIKDGRGVAAADGAEPAEVRPIAEGVIEVAIGGARYRLPATIGETAQ